MEVPLNDEAIVELLRSALREELDQLTFAAEIKNVDQLRSLVQRAETRTKPTGRRVSELTDSNEDANPKNHQNSNNKNHQYKGTCWNCDEQGHGYMVCDKVRRIFCFRCGQKDVVLPRCSRCSPGNRRASGYRTGQNRLQSSSPDK